jgi:putative RNA 2'-phosphotransferase
MSRHHVHLRSDISTVRIVGARHGKPVTFAVDTGVMYAAGYIIYCSDNCVWLVDHIPPEYLSCIKF